MNDIDLEAIAKKYGNKRRAKPFPKLTPKNTYWPSQGSANSYEWWEQKQSDFYDHPKD